MQANRLAIEALKDRLNQERQQEIVRKEHEGMQKLGIILQTYTLWNPYFEGFYMSYDASKICIRKVVS